MSKDVLGRGLCDEWWVVGEYHGRVIFRVRKGVSVVHESVREEIVCCEVGS